MENLGRLTSFKRSRMIGVIEVFCRVTAFTAVKNQVLLVYLRKSVHEWSFQCGHLTIYIHCGLLLSIHLNLLLVLRVDFISRSCFRSKLINIVLLEVHFYLMKYILFKTFNSFEKCTQLRFFKKILKI